MSWKIHDFRSLRWSNNIFLSMSNMHFFIRFGLWSHKVFVKQSCGPSVTIRQCLKLVRILAIIIKTKPDWKLYISWRILWQYLDIFQGNPIIIVIIVTIFNRNDISLILTHFGLPYGNIDSGNDLVPGSTKPLLKPMVSHWQLVP